MNPLQNGRPSPLVVREGVALGIGAVASGFAELMSTAGRAPLFAGQGPAEMIGISRVGRRLAADEDAWSILRGSLEALLPTLVRRLAWTTGDGKRMAMRLEISGGSFMGGSLFVRAEGGRVHLRFDASPCPHPEHWAMRVEQYLAGHGVIADAIEIAPP